MRKIHKRIIATNYEECVPICNKNRFVKTHSWLWKDVTCKKCIELGLNK